MAVILLGFFVIFSTTPPFHCICRHIYMGSSVYCVLNLQRFMVTAVNLLSKSCSIVSTYGFKTSFAWELVGELCEQIRHHSALYMEDSFIYLCWLYSIHWICFGFFGNSLPSIMTPRRKSDSSDVIYCGLEIPRHHWKIIRFSKKIFFRLYSVSIVWMTYCFGIFFDEKSKGIWQ